MEGALRKDNLESHITTATLSDMSFLLNAAKSEGWNPGLFDSIPFYFTDPSGFFIEKLNDKPIGCISAPIYNEAYGFMGFYIVLPEYRSKGYGLKLWNHAINYLGNRVIGLDGVVAQQNNYKKSGFTFFYNNIRYSGKVKGILSKSVVPIDAIPFKILVEYDSKIYGLNRAIFLQHWITLRNSYGFAKTQSNKVLGYGIIRKCEIGYKVGPLFADNSETANEIFLSLLSMCEDKEVFLDVPEINKEAIKLANQYNLQKVFETARMYKGTPPKQQLNHVFGVTTFELG